MIIHFRSVIGQLSLERIEELSPSSEPGISFMRNAEVVYNYRLMLNARDFQGLYPVPIYINIAFWMASTLSQSSMCL